jgi:tetratricopeptide (TPR) repeat protein
MFDQLVELDKQDKLRDYDYHLIAMAHHNKGNYHQAVPYYKKYLLKSPEVYGYTNLSLAYSSSQVGQELDAADCCRMALSIKEDFEKAKKLLTDLEPKLNALKSKVLDFTKKNKIVAENNWFQSYVSPF